MIAQRRRRHQNRKRDVSEAIEKRDEGRHYLVIQEINSNPIVMDTSQLRSSRYAILSKSFADNKNEGDLNVTSKESHGTKMVSNKGKNVATNSNYREKKNNIHGPF